MSGPAAAGGDPNPWEFVPDPLKHTIGKFMRQLGRLSDSGTRRNHARALNRFSRARQMPAIAVTHRSGLFCNAGAKNVLLERFRIFESITRLRLMEIGTDKRPCAIATQLQIPKHKVLNQIARLLAKLGIRDRVEIVLYAYSDPAMYQRISSEVLNRTTKNSQAQTPRVKQKAS